MTYEHMPIEVEIYVEGGKVLSTCPIFCKHYTPGYYTHPHFDWLENLEFNQCKNIVETFTLVYSWAI